MPTLPEERGRRHAANDTTTTPPRGPLFATLRALRDDFTGEPHRPDEPHQAIGAVLAVLCILAERWPSPVARTLAAELVAVARRTARLLTPEGPTTTAEPLLVALETVPRPTRTRGAARRLEPDLRDAARALAGLVAHPAVPLVASERALLEGELVEAAIAYGAACASDAGRYVLPIVRLRGEAALRHAEAQRLLVAVRPRELLAPARHGVAPSSARRLEVARGAELRPAVFLDLPDMAHAHDAQGPTDPTDNPDR